MASGIHRLTAKQVEAAKEPGYYADGGGLMVRVSANGGKRWLYRYTLPGQTRREMGLGSAGPGGVSLKIAREKAAEMREKVQRGLDPIELNSADVEAKRKAARKDAAPSTFGGYVEGYLNSKLKQFRNEKHRYQWRQTLETYAAGIWLKELAEVTHDDVLKLLEPIWDTKHVTAARFRGRLERIFDHAIQNHAYEGDNPARWTLFNATLSAPRKREGRGPYPSMPRSILPDFIAQLRTYQGKSLAAYALEFTILGANRSGEVRFAKWREIDSKNELWVIPSERLKVKSRNGETYTHAVILTQRMLEILKLQHDQHCRIHGTDAPHPDAYIFPGMKGGKPISDMTMRKVLHDMGHEKYTVHGFRSTFRDWAGSDTDFAFDLAEEALAHVLPDVQRAYRREQAISKRRVMMGAWDDFCSGKSTTLPSNVTSLRA